ncbi:alpha/beta hydrolase [Mongoliitalea daihaiensis]|uniref:alpha/beta hydrolase n=1 Tax=Mongoliitalea daihaiensis TaxID=2782006 RepID=UPI001F3D5C6D|nr:alpha/beta hydrolase [Mongoliitalea daihaiensis]UJP65415.1 alpha/beta hydrolase [Mongoliitalea daihaiensis]
MQKLTLIFLIIALSACSLKRVERFKEITYLEASDSLPEKKLNVFKPKKAQNAPVLLFIHGGSWDSGNKEIYNFLGTRFAKKGVVTVIMDYPLSPDYQVQSMALASAHAVNWMYESIEQYGGSKDRLFVSGHSAGGHLASLISVNDRYFQQLEVSNPIKGTVLIDAAGLDMKWFLEEMNYEPGTSYNIPFTDSPEVWEETSPIYHLDSHAPPMLILLGGRTLPGITLTTERFMEAYREIEPNPNFIFQKRKKHKGMIVQFIYTPNKVYREILKFMEE